MSGLFCGTFSFVLYCCSTFSVTFSGAVLAFLVLMPELIMPGSPPVALSAPGRDTALQMETCSLQAGDMDCW